MADKKYFQPVETAQSIQDFYGGKNLISIKINTQTINGVELTTNSDSGSVTANGTATNNVHFVIDYSSLLPGEYILSGTPAISGCAIKINNWGDASLVAIENTGNPVKFTVATRITCTYEITIASGTTLSNASFRPMVRLADTSDGFVPYSPTNQELYNRIANIPGSHYTRNISSRLNTTLYSEIDAGNFSNIKPGDVIKGPVTGTWYFIAHRDLWYGFNNIGFKTTHHVIILPSWPLVNDKMNDTNITTGGYINSKGKLTVDQLIQDYFVKDFGSHIKYFKNFQVNATDSNGIPTGWEWYDTLGDLMSEANVYGHSVLSNSGLNTGIQREQFEVFRDLGTHILGYSDNWLKDINNPTLFAYASTNGSANAYSASGSLGLRPFAVLAA